MKYETFIRNLFRAWQKRDWDFVEKSLAEGFSFTSLYDDHLDKDEYKRKCWDAVKDIAEYDFVTYMEQGDEAFMRYKGWINGTQVQNTEHFLIQDGKIKEITVFFGRPEDSTSQGA
jgi:ketosteroid isomerase-like protein